MKATLQLLCVVSFKWLWPFETTWSCLCVDLGEVWGDSRIPYSLVSKAAEGSVTVLRPRISLTEWGKSLEGIRRDLNLVLMGYNSHILYEKKKCYRSRTPLSAIMLRTYLTILYLHADSFRFAKDFFDVQFHGEFVYML